MINIYTISVLISLFLGITLIVTKKCVIAGKIIINILTVVIVAFFAFLGTLMMTLSNVKANVYSIFILILAVTVIVLISCLIWGVIKKKCFYIPILSVLVITSLSFGGYKLFEIHDERIPTVEESENLLAEYAPYAENTKAVTLDEPSTLMMNSDFPKLDGATALYPIYAAFVKAVYPKEFIADNNTTENEYLKCSTTTGAYEKIVSGDADIIFVAAPSEQQKLFAAEQGVELVYTPIGREAFVFFVNANNPIENLTLEQIQKIYSGEITNWNELGINLGEIKSFQRDEGSGSQSALQRIMMGKELVTPQTKDVIGNMGGIIKKTADYKNYKNAIGFSFRFYSTEMLQNNQIKLLSINDVYPSTENIENNTYPISSEFYAVTRADSEGSVKDFIQWILSEQGQKIIQLTGYTPLNSIPNLNR